jgi:hypothetical protein
MKQLYIHNDKAYLIIRKVPIGKFGIDHHPENMERVKMYKDWIGADHVLRNQTHFMFCETIPDIEFEEIKEEL